MGERRYTSRRRVLSTLSTVGVSSALFVNPVSGSPKGDQVKQNSKARNEIPLEAIEAQSKTEVPDELRRFLIENNNGMASKSAIEKYSSEVLGLEKEVNTMDYITDPGIGGDITAQIVVPIPDNHYCYYVEEVVPIIDFEDCILAGLPSPNPFGVTAQYIEMFLSVAVQKIIAWLADGVTFVIDAYFDFMENLMEYYSSNPPNMDKHGEVQDTRIRESDLDENEVGIVDY